MIADFAVVLVAAAIGLAVVYMLFQSVASVPKEKLEATKVIEQAAAASAVAGSKKQTKELAKQKKTKKEIAAEKAREAELDALVEREALAPSRGLASEKYEVVTLEDSKAKAKAKKDQKKSGSAAASAEVNQEKLEERKAKDRAQGFKVVEAKKDEEKVSSPSTANPAAKGGARSGVKKTKPASPASDRRDELEKKLSSFFKGNSRRRRGDDDYTSPVDAAKADDKKAKLAPNAGVTQKKPIAAASSSAWAEEKEW